MAVIPKQVCFLHEEGKVRRSCGFRTWHRAGRRQNQQSTGMTHTNEAGRCPEIPWIRWILPEFHPRLLQNSEATDRPDTIYYEIQDDIQEDNKVASLDLGTGTGRGISDAKGSPNIATCFGLPRFYPPL